MLLSLSQPAATTSFCSVKTFQPLAADGSSQGHEVAENFRCIRSKICFRENEPDVLKNCKLNKNLLTELSKDIERSVIVKKTSYFCRNVFSANCVIRTNYISFFVSLLRRGSSVCRASFQSSRVGATLLTWVRIPAQEQDVRKNLAASSVSEHEISAQFRNQKKSILP